MSGSGGQPSIGIKRLIDLTVALLGIVVLSPVLAACAVAIRVKMGRPVLFRQRRPGSHERPFVLVKFRTMSAVRGPGGSPLPDRERLSELGRFLRRSSLDELPTLLNVLWGDMSLVGPRPLLMRYLPYYTATERRRFEMRPGITGLAQVRGRNMLSWTDRLAADVEYVDRWTLALDLQILLRTLGQVARGQDVLEDANMLLRDLDVERAGEGTAT